MVKYCNNIVTYRVVRVTKITGSSSEVPMGYWKKTRIYFQTIYIANWCTYLTLLFDIVSIIVGATVVAGYQFLYPCMVERCRLRCKPRVNGSLRVREVNVLACRITCSSVSIFGTQREHNFRKRSLSDTISWKVTVKLVEKSRKVTKWWIVCSLECSLPLHAPNLH
jgi:hypothetical protein